MLFGVDVHGMTPGLPCQQSQWDGIAVIGFVADVRRGFSPCSNAGGEWGIAGAGAVSGSGVTDGLCHRQPCGNLVVSPPRERPKSLVPPFWPLRLSGGGLLVDHAPVSSRARCSHCPAHYQMVQTRAPRRTRFAQAREPLLCKVFHLPYALGQVVPVEAPERSNP